MTADCAKSIAKPSKGIYYIEEALYLRCLTNQLDDISLIERLAEDYSQHQGLPDYEKYMNQLANANLSEKGNSPMCCEGIFRLCGTTSKEFYDKGFQDCADKVREIIDGKDIEIANKDAEIADKDAEILRLKNCCQYSVNLY